MRLDLRLMIVQPHNLQESPKISSSCDEVKLRHVLLPFSAPIRHLQLLADRTERWLPLLFSRKWQEQICR